MEPDRSRLRPGQATIRVATLGLENLSWLGGTALTLAAVFTILMVGTAAMRVVNRGPAASDDPCVGSIERFCRRLAAAADVHRDDAEGPLDYARRASEALPEQAAAIRGITDLYVAARYAPPLPPAAKRAAGPGCLARGGERFPARAAQSLRPRRLPTQEIFGRGAEN